MIIRRSTRRLALHEKSMTVTYGILRVSDGLTLVESSASNDERAEPAKQRPAHVGPPAPVGGGFRWLRRILEFSLRGGGRLLLVVLAFWGNGAVSAPAQTNPVQTFYVHTTVDAVDLKPGDGICDTGQKTASGAAQCTLRAAIDEANTSSGTNTPVAVSVPARTYLLTVDESWPVQGS